MKPLRIHYFQHVAFEGLGNIETWALLHGHQLTATRFYAQDLLPDLANIDWLVVMGGPMGVYDEAQHAWLAAEKTFIRQAIDAGKTLLGVCLGAQLIAEVLGAKVYPNTQKEIGWFDIQATPQAAQNPVWASVPPTLKVFHWHGDTFELPPHTQHLAFSAACQQQAYAHENGKILGLQFHLEATEKLLQMMLENGQNELTAAPFVQTAAQIVEQHCVPENKKVLFDILDHLAQPFA